jgi:predicted GIY-YIG superfamily endonuclease
MAKTITIHLPSGSPDGIKIAELSNRIVRAYVVPRNLLVEARKYEDLSKPALYVLVSKDGEQSYIGESENFLERIKTHNADTDKDYWDLVLVFVAKDSSLEKSDVGYLEAIACERASEAQKTELKNRTVPARNNLQQFKVSAVEEFFEDCCLLSSAFGFPIFDVLTKDEVENSEVWFCKTKETEAMGVFDGSGFAILAGSKIDKDYSDTWANSHPGSLQKRNEIFEKFGEDKDGVVVLKNNISFRSPNDAGGFAAGRSVNAWTTWKNKDGRTMDEVLR